MMTRNLLVLINAHSAELILYYGGCIVIIAAVIIVMAILKNKTKKELRPATVKKSCIKAKVVAEKVLADKKNLKVLAGARLLKLNKYVANAFWYAFQIADTKKDIVFEGISATLDGLSSQLVKEANNGYITEEEYEAQIRNAIDVLNSVVEKIKALEA